MKHFLSLFAVITMTVSALAEQPDKTIRIDAGRSSIDLAVGKDGRLYQTRFADVRMTRAGDCQPEEEAYIPAGERSLLEPALRIQHADGNTSTALEFVGVKTSSPAPEVQETRIELRDPLYPVHVTLCYRAYKAEEIIETWTEISHEESGPIVIEEAASSAPSFGTDRYVLTHYRGDWADEMHEENELLGYGIKSLQSRGGTRAHRFQAPFFLLSRDVESTETEGKVFGGTIAYPGNFSFAFEVDSQSRLRAVCGINFEGSRYLLEPARTFTTPAMIWAWSGDGRGDLSRRFARWGRSHGMRDGLSTRQVLLNNWEATFFNFDEAKLEKLLSQAKDLGFELFLLDDGWFGNKFPRNDDTQGLGDWKVNQKKLPRGISYVAEDAVGKGLRFGLWLEPEMVNPRSELFEQHPDWVIQQPSRQISLERNQLVLDLSNPEVREWMFKTVDDILTANPKISYVKWDCNRMITQPGSDYLPAGKQQNLFIDYQTALFDVMDRLVAKHPNVEMMICSSGGGRVDYGSLRRGHEFWPSDNTDPLARVRIQWGFEQFFPTNAIAAHVTGWNSRPLKFSYDVAMSARMGMDMDPSHFSPEQTEFVKAANAAYKGIRDTVQLGDVYRLESPFKSSRVSQMNVLPDRSRAALFVWQIAEGHPSSLKLPGLDPAATYRLRELNLESGRDSILKDTPETRSGRDLMEQGIWVPFTKQFQSAVIEIVRE
jgi:alpha-galactosidase